MSTESPSAPAEPVVTVSDFRLSFVWIETIFDAVLGNTQLAEQFRFLQKKVTYAPEFEKALRGGGASNLHVPWEGRKQQFFWKHFLGSGTLLDQVSGNLAWSRFVPLRAALPITATHDKLKQVSLEGFYYPHAFALAITCRFTGRLPLDGSADLAYKIKRGAEKFSVRRGSVPSAQSLSIDSLADEAMQWMREMFLGKTATPKPSPDVFTIFTVVCAEPFAKFKQVGPIHAALQKVTEWPADPDTSNPLPESQIRIPVKKTTADGSIMVGSRRARAIWFPGLFSKKDRTKPSLSCYHRNQVFSALQVESLCGFAIGVLDTIKGGTAFDDLDPAVRSLARNAVDRLTDLYIADSQKRNTYCSSSSKDQVDRNYFNRINELIPLVDASAPKLGASAAPPAGGTAQNPGPNT